MRRLLRLQLALAVYGLWLFLAEWASNVAAKTSTAGSWNPSGKQTSASEVTASAAHAGEMLVETGPLSCKSFDLLGYTGRVNFVETLAVAGLSSGNVAFRVPAGATVTGSGTISLEGTSKSPVNLIYGGGHTFTNSLTLAGTGTFKLEEAWKSSKPINLSKTGVTLETNGQEVEVNRLLGSSGAVTINITNSTVKLTAANEMVWQAQAEATVTSTGSAIEVTDTGTEEKKFVGGGKTYNIMKVLGPNVVVEGANTFATLTVNNKGAGASKGLRLAKGVTQTVTALTLNGTAEAKNRLESTGAAEAATLKIPGDLEVKGSVIVRDIHVTGGTLYLPEGEGPEGGNENIVFAEKPSGEAPEDVMLV